MTDFYYSGPSGTRTGVGGAPSSSISKDDTSAWSNVAVVWAIANAQDALRTVVDANDGDSLVFDSGTNTLSAQITPDFNAFDRAFAIEGRDETSILDTSEASQALINMNDGGAGGAHDLSIKSLSIRKSASPSNNTAMIAASNNQGPIRLLEGSSIGWVTVTRAATALAALLFQNFGASAAGRLFEYSGASVESVTMTTGSSGEDPSSIILNGNMATVDIDGLDIKDITINNNSTSTTATSQFFLLNAAPSQVRGITTENVNSFGTGTGILRGVMTYSDNAADLIASNCNFNDITMDGGATAEAQAWGFNIENDAHAVLTNIDSSNCHKSNNTNSIGGIALSLGRTSEDVASKITLYNCNVDNCSGVFGAGGYGTAGGDLEVHFGTCTDIVDGGNPTAFGVPNGTAWYKGGTGDMLLEDCIATRCSSDNALELGQSIYAHNNPGNPDTGFDRVCNSVIRRVRVQGLTDTAHSPSTHFRNNNPTNAHNVTIDDCTFDNDGVWELGMAATQAGAVINATVQNTKLRGYTGPSDANLTLTTDTDYGSFKITVAAGATVNLTIINVEALTDSSDTTPYQSTIYRIGNGAPSESVSFYAYSNPVQSSIEVTANRFFAGVDRFDFNPGDIMACQLSDGYFELTFTDDSTAEIAV